MDLVATFASVANVPEKVLHKQPKVVNEFFRRRSLRNNDFAGIRSFQLFAPPKAPIASGKIRAIDLVSRESKSATGIASPDADLTNDQLQRIVEAALDTVRNGSSVLAIVPDKTRNDNTHILFPASANYLAKKGIAFSAKSTHISLQISVPLCSKIP